MNFILRLLRLLRRLFTPRRWTRAEYLAYLVTPAWRVKARKCKERANMRCELCGWRGELHTLQAHHKVYTRLGHERASDLQCLCDRCHRRVSGK